MQLDRRVDDPFPRLVLPFGSLLEGVRPRHKSMIHSASSKLTRVYSGVISLVAIGDTHRYSKERGAAMSVQSGPTVEPIALRPDEGEAIWAFGVLATIKASSETTEGRVAVIEHLGPQGRVAFARPPARGRVVLRDRGRGQALGRRRGDRRSRRLVRLRAARRPAHVHDQLAASPLPARHRACRLRELHAGDGAACCRA